MNYILVMTGTGTTNSLLVGGDLEQDAMRQLNEQLCSDINGHMIPTLVLLLNDVWQPCITQTNDEDFDIEHCMQALLDNASKFWEKAAVHHDTTRRNEHLLATDYPESMPQKPQTVNTDASKASGSNQKSSLYQQESPAAADSPTQPEPICDNPRLQTPLSSATITKGQTKG